MRNVSEVLIVHQDSIRNILSTIFIDKSHFFMDLRISMIILELTVNHDLIYYEFYTLL